MKSVAIVGAGIGGLTIAIKLQRQIGNVNFTIYEKGPSIGGTWRDNIYPGASSDIGAHFYSLSTDLNPNWSHTLGSQREIQEYWLGLAKKYDLYPKIVFNTRITWENLLTGEVVSTTAEIFVSATGILEQPIPKYQVYRPSRGIHFILHDGGMIFALKAGELALLEMGHPRTPSSQFMPFISQDPSIKVTQFMRTPNWLLPPRRFPVPVTLKWACTYFPLTMRILRLMQFFRGELLYMVFASKFVRELSQMYSERYTRQNAPAQYQDQLIPKYPLGCKRIVFDTDFLECLHRPNVSLSTDGISAIVEDGVINQRGEKIALDVIIFATGFNSHEYPIKIHGRSGQTVQDYYETYSAPRAYLGTTLPGFPNFYMISGPNTATGHTSVVYSEELQVNYCLALILPVLQGKVFAFEVTSEATDAFNDWLQGRLSRSAFTQCRSWYRVGGDGINSVIFPGSQILHWWILRKPVWSHYIVVKGDAWAQEHLGRAVGVVPCALCLISSLSVSTLPAPYAV